VTCHCFQCRKTTKKIIYLNAYLHFPDLVLYCSLSKGGLLFFFFSILYFFGFFFVLILKCLRTNRYSIILRPFRDNRVSICDYCSLRLAYFAGDLCGASLFRRMRNRDSCCCAPGGYGRDSSSCTFRFSLDALLLFFLPDTTTHPSSSLVLNAILQGVLLFSSRFSRLFSVFLFPNSKLVNPLNIVRFTAQISYGNRPRVSATLAGARRLGDRRVGISLDLGAI